MSTDLPPAKSPPKAFGQLKALGPAVMAEVDRRLKAGESGLTVARWIQHDLKQMGGIQEASLKKNLERYRTFELRPRLEALLKQSITAAPLPALVRQVDGLDRLENLAALQQARVEKILEREKSMPGGIFLSETKNEIRLLKDILDAVARLQLETGRIKRAAKTVKGFAVDENGNTRPFAWTEETEALYERLSVLEVEDA